MFLKSYIFYTKHKKLIFEKIIGGGGAVPPLPPVPTALELNLYYFMLAIKTPTTLTPVHNRVPITKLNFYP